MSSRATAGQIVDIYEVIFVRPDDQHDGRWDIFTDPEGARHIDTLPEDVLRALVDQGAVDVQDITTGKRWC